MSPEKTTSDLFIIGALQKGYWADKAGRIFSPSGREIGKGQAKRSGHLSVTLYVKGINKRNFQAVLVHRFIAAYHFGEHVLNEECIRHLNDIPDDNRVENLCPGTVVENRADIPREVLSRIAKARAPELIERSRKLSDDDIRAMRSVRANSTKSYADIAAQFNVSAMTAYRAINQQSWKEIA